MSGAGGAAGGGGQLSRSSMLDAPETLSDVAALAPDTQIQTRAERAVSTETPPHADATAAVPPPPDAQHAAATVAPAAAGDAPSASAPAAPAAPTATPAPECTAEQLRPVTMRTESHEPRSAGEGELLRLCTFPAIALLIRCKFTCSAYALYEVEFHQMLVACLLLFTLISDY